MKRRFSHVSEGLALTVVLLLYCPRLQATSTVCSGAVTLRPDGMEVTRTFTANNQDRWFQFTAKANRSYAALAENISDSDLMDIVFWDTPLVGCGGGMVPGIFTGVLVEPIGAIQSLSEGAAQWAFINNADREIFFRFSNGTGTGGSFRVRLVETTMFSPRWSTFGGFFTSWGFHNTTNATIMGTLRVINSAGTEVANVTFDIPPGQVVFRDTRATNLNLAANQAGNAIFTHNGPPGAIQADAFFLNADATVVVPGKFETARQQR